MSLLEEKDNDFDKNIEIINSCLFNSLLECEDGKEYFLKNEK